MTDQAPTTPPIELSFNRMFCGIHGEPFREQWPRGAIIFQLKAFEALVDDPAFCAEAGGDISPSTIEPLLDKRPVCCRLGGEKLLETYEWQHANKGIGSKGFCHNPHCGRFALGAPFLQLVPGQGSQRIPHICFRCVAMFVIPRAS